MNLLNKHKINSFFNFIQGYLFGFYKPNPKVFEKVFKECKEAGIKKEEIVYVGDSLIDYESAKNSGIDFFAVLIGLTDSEVFINEGVNKERILSSIAKLPKVLFK